MVFSGLNSKDEVSSTNTTSDTWYSKDVGLVLNEAPALGCPGDITKPRIWFIKRMQDININSV